MSRKRIGVLVAVVLTIAGVPSLGQAQTSGSCTVAQTQDLRRGAARENFQRGQQLFDTNDYAAALSSFECSFQNVPHPSTLYNIARSAELSGQFNRALDAWRGYLQINPEAEDRAEIEQRITGLEQAVAAQQAVQSYDPNVGNPPPQTYQPTNMSAAAAPTNWESPTNVSSDVYTPNVAPGQEYQVVETVPRSPWRTYSWYMFSGGLALAAIGLILATPIITQFTSTDTTVFDEDNPEGRACYVGLAAEADGQYQVEPSCYISGAVLAGIGGAVMIASILVWALSARGGQRVVTRRARTFTPTLALDHDGGVAALGGLLTMAF